LTERLIDKAKPTRPRLLMHLLMNITIIMTMKYVYSTQSLYSGCLQI